MAYFRLCKSRGGYYLTARVSFWVSWAPSNNKGWKSRYLFVSGLVWGFRLDWSGHPIGNAPPFLSEEEFVLVDRLKGILSSSCAIKEMTELWLVKAGLSPTSRDQMHLGDLRGMPKMSGGKAPSTRVAAPAQEVGVSPAREAPKASSKRPIDAPTEQVNDSARRHKKVKVLTGDRSISDQKNLDGLSPVKNAWMARDGWRFEIPWTCEGHLGAECSDVLCRVTAAIVRLEDRESEGGRERLVLYLGSERGTVVRAFSNLPS
ncbi:hypothetical protein BHM03_00014306 [Ensete ventricosum]|nr:hypothetical protein BHM03_00014306 [Ensete ventricosum]